MKSQGNKIMVLGGSGLIGSSIVAGLSDRYSLCVPAHSEADVTDQKQISAYIAKMHPDFIVYATGLARVDTCEDNPRLASLLNSTAPGYIAELGIPMVYISTDAVFDGKPRKNPYTEDDIPDPFSVYGETKLQGERAVCEASEMHTILRVVSPFTYRKHLRTDFMRRAVDTLTRRAPYPGISDQLISPLLLDALPRAIDAIISVRQHGVFHLGSTDHATNLEILTRVARLYGFDESFVTPVTLSHYLRVKKAKRARYCVLDTHKFQRFVRCDILPDIETSIRTFHKHYTHP